MTASRTILRDIRAWCPYEMPELGVRAARAFAKINGWRFQGASLQLRALADNPDDFHRFICSDVLDHVLAFGNPVRRVAMVGQPYDHSLFSEEIRELNSRYGLAAHTPPAPLASFHYPGRCRFIVFTRPGVTVRWLPEQEDV